MTPQSNEAPSPVEKLDLTEVPCPENSSRALLALELMDAGEVLEILVDDGKPCETVPTSLEWEGHVILSMKRTGGVWRMLVQRGDD